MEGLREIGLMKTVGWVRGDKNDYDAWAKVVGDERWSYEGFLPYFKKTEHYHTTDLDVSQHGYDGPLYTQSVASSDGAIRSRRM